MLDYDFEVVRTDRFPGQIWSAIVTSGDDVVLTGDIRTRESVGHYLHILRSSGEILSYGEDGGVYPSQSTNRPFWGADVAGKDDDTVWVIPPGANRILRWDLRPGPPQVGRVLERRVAAFDEDAMPGMYPGSYVNGGVLDDRGLWIMWHTPDPEWTERVPEFETETEPPQQARQVWDGWLDLVDPATGRTLARHRDDAKFSGFAAGSSYVVVYHETDAGVPYLHLLEPKLSRR